MLIAPPGAPTCARRSAKDVIVTSLTVTATRDFRAVGSAAIAGAAKGTSTFVLSDRCKTTVTQVRSGKVAVVAKRGGRTHTVRAGRALATRAR